MREEWRPVTGRETEYEVSSLGRVRNARGRVLRPQRGSHGYPHVDLGRNKTKLIHILVATAFLGPVPEGQEVRHRNGNKFDPRVRNLQYGTRLQNIQDAIAHGTYMSEARWRQIDRLARAKRNG